MFAKTIMPGKFWILEEKGQKVGTIHNGDNVFTLTFKGGLRRYTDVKTLEEELEVNLGTSAIEAAAAMTNDTVDGFPTEWNTVYNKLDKEVHPTLPVFTKSEKSKSYHSAGYYGVRFPNGWTQSFCPRVNTLNSYEFVGPYKTEMEMTVAIQRKKNERAQ